MIDAKTRIAYYTEWLEQAKAGLKDPTLPFWEGADDSQIPYSRYEEITGQPLAEHIEWLEHAVAYWEGF